MNRYGQLVYKYLKNNKKRTVSTILGVVMSAILIFGVINIIFCQLQKGIDNAKEMYNFDAVFYNLGENDAKVIQNYPGVAVSYTGGFDEKVFSGNNIVFVDDFNHNPYNIKLETGHYPNGEHQVLLNATTETGYHVGDVITLLADKTGLNEDTDLEIVGTFTVQGDYRKISGYEYSYIEYIGCTKDISMDISAVYVSYENPYNIAKLSKEISETTGTKYYINDSIALYYNQNSEGSIQAVYAAMMMAFIMVIACMAAFVIKNTLRISIAERMRDYGVLRCAGASLKQLSYMVRKEALVIGGISSVIGIVISYAIQLIFSLISEVYDFRHFYILSAVITLFVCVITMLIATIEPCNIIKRLTPVEAVRNHMKASDREKIKERKAKIITKLFGIGGSYAYKNVMRNPKQFLVRVISLTLGIVLFTCTQTLCNTFEAHYKDVLEIGDGYYNVVIDYNYALLDMDAYANEEDMPSVDEFCRRRDMAALELKQLPETGETVRKRNFIALKGYCLTDGIEKRDLRTLYKESYIKANPYVQSLQMEYPADENEEDIKYYEGTAVDVGPVIVSYDADMFYKYDDYLIEGTCDVDELGENGIILYNRTKLPGQDENTGISVENSYDVLDYEVGDTISFVAAPKDVYDKKLKAVAQEYNEYVPGPVRYNIYKELYDEGYIKTYTIKGIVEANALEDVYEEWNNDPQVIMTNEQFHDFLPGWEEDYTVGQYVCHADGFDYDVYNILNKNNAYARYLYEGEFFKGVDTVEKTCSIILIIILLFMTINIFNNTSSSMVFRKGEFALLRCIGMSRRRLTYVVLLEGIIATLFASVLGLGISIFAVIGMRKYMYYTGFPSVVIPYGSIAFAILLLFAIMALASWIPLLAIKNEIAPALAETDE
ncbi:MAG: ABC transporter permease [Coprococcus sp.]|nr:ABC transporter permease [Coprococcus sp.]